MPDITGTNGDDILVGTDTADAISGLEGNDRLTGGRGGDVLTGGTGSDAFIFLAGTDSLRSGAMDIVTDFSSDDVIDLRGLNVTAIDIAYVTPVGRPGARAAYVSADTPDGRFQIYVSSLSSVLILDNVLTTAVRRYYSNPDGQGIGASSNDDIMYGSSDGEFFYGSDGADLMFGFGSVDSFFYTSASQSTRSRYDTIVDFETGVDRFVLDARININSLVLVRNESGGTHMFIETTQGPMTIAAQTLINGTDIIRAGTFDVTIFGSTLGDVISSERGADYIFGGAGSDLISGGFGFDHLHGEDGDDILIGGGGSDALFGGSGSDIFRYTSTLDSGDIIADFVSGLDRIDLSQVRLRTSDRFEIVYSGTGTLLFVDIQGDGSNDILIQLANVRLVASDIIWGTINGALEGSLKSGSPEFVPIEESVANLAGQTGGFAPDLDPALSGGFDHGQDWYL